MLKSGTYGIKIKIVRNLFREDRDRRKATVSFMAQKLILDAEDDRFDEILAAAKKEISKVEKDCRVLD